MIVGDATEQLGSRMGPGGWNFTIRAGNLPELFVAIFALRAGLANVVQAALVGSILGNSLLVFGAALFLGGLRNGTQRFKSEPPRMIVTLMMLAVSALIIPTLASMLHTPAAPHIDDLDIVVAIILLVIFAASTYFSIKGDSLVAPKKITSANREWPMWMAIVVLGIAGVGAAFVSDWFVDAASACHVGTRYFRSVCGTCDRCDRRKCYRESSRRPTRLAKSS